MDTNWHNDGIVIEIEYTYTIYTALVIFFHTLFSLGESGNLPHPHQISAQQQVTSNNCLLLAATRSDLLLQ